MEAITVKRSGQRAIQFSGKLRAEVQTSSNNASSEYSGATGRSDQVRIYETESGKYVVAQQHYSQWQGDPSVVHEAETYASLADIADWIENESPLPIWARDSLLEDLNVPPVTL